MCKAKRSGGNLTEMAENCMEVDVILEEASGAGMTCVSNSNDGIHPDSGLGTSGNSSGPSHIDDWSSLSVLLPRYRTY